VPAASTTSHVRLPLMIGWPSYHSSTTVRLASGGLVKYLINPRAHSWPRHWSLAPVMARPLCCFSTKLSTAENANGMAAHACCSFEARAHVELLARIRPIAGTVSVR
jgi:hypothetical protein